MESVPCSEWSLTRVGSFAQPEERPPCHPDCLRCSQRIKQRAVVSRTLSLRAKRCLTPRTRRAQWSVVGSALARGRTESVLSVNSVPQRFRISVQNSTDREHGSSGEFALPVTSRLAAYGLLFRPRMRHAPIRLRATGYSLAATARGRANPPDEPGADFALSLRASPPSGTARQSIEFSPLVARGFCPARHPCFRSDCHGGLASHGDAAVPARSIVRNAPDFRSTVAACSVRVWTPSVVVCSWPTTTRWPGNIHVAT